MSNPYLQMKSSGKKFNHVRRERRTIEASALVLSPIKTKAINESNKKSLRGSSSHRAYSKPKHIDNKSPGLASSSLLKDRLTRKLRQSKSRRNERK